MVCPWWCLRIAWHRWMDSRRPPEAFGPVDTIPDPCKRYAGNHLAGRAGDCTHMYCSRCRRAVRGSCMALVYVSDKCSADNSMVRSALTELDYTSQWFDCRVGDWWIWLYRKFRYNIRSNDKLDTTGIIWNWNRFVLLPRLLGLLHNSCAYCISAEFIALACHSIECMYYLQKCVTHTQNPTIICH